MKDFNKEYLTSISQILPKGLPNPPYTFRSPQDFILKYGKPYRNRIALPKGIEQGKAGECFKNAALLAIENPSLIYCEGVANSIIPTEHAWCIDKDGNVIDNTWLPEWKPSYYGVAFKTKFLLHLIWEQDYYGIITCWQKAHPLLKMPVKEVEAGLYKFKANDKNS